MRGRGGTDGWINGKDQKWYNNTGFDWMGMGLGKDCVKNGCIGYRLSGQRFRKLDSGELVDELLRPRIRRRCGRGQIRRGRATQTAVSNIIPIHINLPPGPLYSTILKSALSADLVNRVDAVLSSEL